MELRKGTGWLDPYGLSPVVRNFVIASSPPDSDIFFFSISISLNLFLRTKLALEMAIWRDRSALALEILYCALTLPELIRILPNP